jgi:hypothetical protein
MCSDQVSKLKTGTSVSWEVPLFWSLLFAIDYPVADNPNGHQRLKIFGEEIDTLFQRKFPCRQLPHRNRWGE